MLRGSPSPPLCSAGVSDCGLGPQPASSREEAEGTRPAPRLRGSSSTRRVRTPHARTRRSLWGSGSLRVTEQKRGDMAADKMANIGFRRVFIYTAFAPPLCEQGVGLRTRFLRVVFVSACVSSEVVTLSVSSRRPAAAVCKPAGPSDCRRGA